MRALCELDFPEVPAEFDLLIIVECLVMEDEGGVVIHAGLDCRHLVVG